MYMKKLTIVITMFSIARGWSDANKGIKFENGLSWSQILAKAKTDNKYIFVDCYATWCGPCKEMDKKIYPSEKLGAIMNE